MKNLIELDDNDTIIGISVLSQEDQSLKLSTLKDKLALTGNYVIEQVPNGIGLGDVYNSDKKRLEPAQPFASWTWNEDAYQWDPPAARPKVLNATWDESQGCWIL